MSTRFAPSLISALVIAAALAGMAPAAHAFTGGANDFIPTYTGPKGGDLDVLSANVFFDGTTFALTTTLNAAVGTTPSTTVGTTTSSVLYVWGFNRGASTALFSPAIPNTDQVKFDSVVSIGQDGSGAVIPFVRGGTNTPFTAAASVISGATITTKIAASTLPTLGFTPSNCTWNLWPRFGTGNNNQISDFAPVNSNAPIVVTAPESGTGSLLAAAALCALAGAVVLRRRVAQAG